MAEIPLYEAMRTLRAVRRLRPDPIPDAVLRRVLDAACQAPSGGNRQPFRIVVVRDRAKLARLATLYAEEWQAYAGLHREQTARASDQVRSADQRMLDAGNHLADHFGELPALLVFCFDPRQMAITDAGLARVSVVGGASIYPAVQNALLACRAEGLGCVLTTLLCRCEDVVRKLLEIPEPWATAAAIPIGYPVGRGHGPISRRPPEELAYADRWKSPWPAGRPD